MLRLGYSIEEVSLELLKEGLSYDLIEGEKKCRGRPRKVEGIELEETIEVLEITKDGKKYLRTKENVLLDPITYEIVGMDIKKK